MPIHQSHQLQSHESARANSFWNQFSVRKLVSALLIVVFLCLLPFLVNRWRSKTVVALTRSHGGRVLLSHGYCPKVFCLAWVPELEPFTETISYIPLPDKGNFQVTDEFIKCFRKQSFLTVLALGNEENPNTLTDQSLDTLSHFPIEYLYF